MKRILFFMLVLLFVLPRIASAHAELVNSQPKEGETVKQSIDTLTLQFGEEVEKFINFKITNETGESIPLEPPSISGKTVLVMTKKPLPAGDYTAQWELVSADGHNATGQLAFKVGQQLKEKTDKPDQNAKSNNNAVQNKLSRPSSNHQTLYIVIVVVLAAILAVGGMTIFRKKQK